ncbi:MBL fold metallo-hydrolase [Bauldia sp.]|uniref:MBL fold metallo-hydrolase n=1 Tax=Bauldia sp. TaxID=2575872 RepID=UPI003BA9C0AC
MRLQVTILGCGSSPGVPRIGNDWGVCDPAEPRNRRRRCALLVEQFNDGPEPTRVLVDTGPDMREQLLDAQVGRIDAVVYTHAHADHLHGIDDLRAFWLNARQLVRLYADAPTASRIKEAFSYCFESAANGLYPPILELDTIVAGELFTASGPGGAIDVEPIAQNHGPGTSVGFRFGPIAYSCDVSALPDDSVSRLQGLDTWIVGALRREPHPSHFTVDQALDWIGRVAPKRAVLTHMHNDLDYRTLRDELPDHVEPGYDGMRITAEIQDQKVP